jgi:hypothetical protein
MQRNGRENIYVLYGPQVQVTKYKKKPSLSAAEGSDDDCEIEVKESCLMLGFKG